MNDTQPTYHPGVITGVSRKSGAYFTQVVGSTPYSAGRLPIEDKPCTAHFAGRVWQYAYTYNLINERVDYGDGWKVYFVRPLTWPLTMADALNDPDLHAAMLADYDSTVEGLR